ncbi:hypothetical protein ATSB10_02870 [Dyella thiooxydans]|uniref:DUF2170 domain-containing protein n=1 Tax=Dyella thiooxydans TaxID=445710 RepID=A0A160MX07_9GAMM|nr:DUF2170 family protein [Dyella thiooxydans]AND67741.1 hypothetical protein ATSB10_02870 [Dyella thiooxydans]
MTGRDTRELHRQLDKRYADTNDITVELIDEAEPVINLTLHAYGDMQVQVAASSSQIAVSTVLVDAELVRDRSGFNDACMRINPINPLSNLGLTQIGGRDTYIVFGELSTQASMDELDEELQALALNTLDAAETLKTHFL